MLVSLACVILLMLAYTQLFAEAGARINDARAQIDVTNRLRSAVTQLRNDLEGLTAHTIPGLRPEGGAGYLEIIEGRLRDTRVNDDAGVTADINEGSYPLGDVDDGLMLTVRKKNGNFTGKAWVDANNDTVFQSSELQTIQSETAEVVWFLRPTIQPDPASPGPSNPAMVVSPVTYTLYRRTLLVTPSYAGTFPGIPAPSTVPHIPPVSNPPTQTFRESFYDRYDVSARYESASSRYVANTLADLTKRECRYGHNVNNGVAQRGFPHGIDDRWMWPFGVTYDSGNSRYYVNTSHIRYGEDVVLTNVLAFDVQVWDPTAPVYLEGPLSNRVAVAPGDPGFQYPPGVAIPTNRVPESIGAYVDLNWHNDTWTGGTVYAPWTPNPPRLVMSPFFSTGHPRSDTLVANFVPPPSSRPAIFDTFSYHYDHDGIDQDNDGFFDEGTDGFDNDGNNGVDDPSERETSPPYPAPLRGIKVRLRVYEPDTRQIREVSVVHSFVPE